MCALSCFHLVLPGGSSHGPALSEPFVNPTPQETFHFIQAACAKDLIQIS